MNEERIKEIFADEEFVKELFSKETPQEAQELLAEKDIDISIEYLCKVMEKATEKQENPDTAELTDEALEEVSGGAAVARSEFTMERKFY